MINKPARTVIIWPGEVTAATSGVTFSTIFIRGKKSKIAIIIPDVVSMSAILTTVPGINPAGAPRAFIIA